MEWTFDWFNETFCPGSWLPQRNEWMNKEKTLVFELWMVSFIWLCGVWLIWFAFVFCLVGGLWPACRQWLRPRKANKDKKQMKQSTKQKEKERERKQSKWINWWKEEKSIYECCLLCWAVHQAAPPRGKPREPINQIHQFPRKWKRGIDWSWVGFRGSWFVLLSLISFFLPSFLYWMRQLGQHSIKRKKIS